MTPTSSPSYAKWANFPVDYRAEEVATILQWVKLSESGVVVGGSGTGKSNIAGYLASRPDVTSGYLPEPPTNYLFVYLDFNALPSINTPNFYRFVLYTLQEVLVNDAELSQRLEQMIARITNPEDVFALYMAVRQAHDLIIRDADKQIIWLLDRFDEGCQRLEAETLNSLRSLRDQYKDRLSLIAFTRYPLARLRNPAEYDELHEIMIMNTCYVGPMNWRDGQWPAAQTMNRYQKSLPAVAIQEIYKLCGGLPAFLKIAYTALAAEDLAANESPDQWRRKIRAIPAFQRNCQEIWDSYTPVEQAALRVLALQPDQGPIPPEVASYLQQMGILQKSYNGETLELFSPLFADFIRGQTEGERGLAVRDNMVYRNGMPLPAPLTRQEFDLLSYLYKRENCVCEREELSKHLWPDDVMVVESEERLNGLIRRLRRKIEVDNGHKYIENIRGRGYKFVQASQG